MFGQRSPYLTQSVSRARGMREREAGMLRPRSAAAERLPSVSTSTMFGAAALAAVVGLAYYFGPDLVRYLKIRRM